MENKGAMIATVVVDPFHSRLVFDEEHLDTTRVGDDATQCRSREERYRLGQNGELDIRCVK